MKNSILLLVLLFPFSHFVAAYSDMHVILGADDITVSTASGDGVLIDFDVTAVDFKDRSVAVECFPSSGSMFVMGSTTVTCSTTEGRTRRRTSETFVVTVVEELASSTEKVDSDKHVIVGANNVNVETLSTDGAVVDFDVSAIDFLDRPVAVECLPSSGSLFALGDTLVSCSTTEGRLRRRTSESFTVSVVEAELAASTPEVSSDAGSALDGEEGLSGTGSGQSTVEDSMSEEQVSVDGTGIQSPTSGDGSSLAGPVDGVSGTTSGEGGAGTTTNDDSIVVGGSTSQGEVGSDADTTLHAVTLSWTAPSLRENGDELSLSEISKYEIYVIGEFTGTDQVLVVNDGSADQFSLADLPGDTYHIAISTVDSNGLRSEPSDMVTVTLGQ